MVWLVASLIGIFLRLYPLWTFGSSDSTEKATVLVLANIRQKVTDNIDKNFPHLSPTERNVLIQKGVEKIMRQDRAKMHRTIQRVTKEIDAQHSDRPATPYLLASDSYNYFSLTENIIRTGRLSETIKGSKYFHKLMLAPEGHWEPLTLHPWVGYLIYRIVKFFNPDATTMFAVSFTPLVVTVLALIPFLGLCAFLGCRPVVSFVAAIFLLTSSIILKRSMFGWYDNDPYHLPFLFTLLLCLFQGLKNLRNLKKSSLLGGLGALVLTLYAFFWHGWMFFLSVVGVAGIFCLLFNHFILNDRRATRPLIGFFAIFFLGTLGGISLTFGPSEFFVLFHEGWKALNDFVQPRLSLWPPLYIGVGELNKPSWPELVNLLGGYVFVLGALFGGIIAWFKMKRSSVEFNPFAVIVLTILAFATLILAKGALRFAFLAVIPVSLFFPIALQLFFSTLAKKCRPLLASLLMSGLTLLFVAVPIFKAHQETPSLLNQIFNASWENALLKIKRETPPESIINTWWPPGHFIKAIAERRVTFDGATINKPQGYWLANVFLAKEEEEALGILRMLNTSANQAADYLTHEGIPLSQTVKILKVIVRRSQTQARIFLADKLSPGQIEHLLRLTHARPPPSYLFLYNDLVEKNMQLKFIGGWDFEKVEKINQNPEVLKRLPPPQSLDFIRFLWNIAGGPYEYSGVLGQISKEGELIRFEKNITVALASKKCWIDSGDTKGIPYSLFYLDKDRVVEKKFPEANLPLSVLIFEDKNLFHGVVLDPRLARSLLIHLYFLDGKGLKYLEPFLQEKDLTRRTQIYIYHVNWEKFLNDLGEF